MIESDNSEFDNDEIWCHHRVKSDIDDSSNNPRGVRNNAQAEDGYERLFVSFNVPNVLSDSKNRNN